MSNVNIVATAPSTNPVAGAGTWTVTLPANRGTLGIDPITVTATDVTEGLQSAPVTFNLTVSPTPEHSYTNSTYITINDVTNAAPYPSTIDVEGLKGRVSTVKVTLYGFNHSYPSDVGVLLVNSGPVNGATENVVLMNRAGDGTPIWWPTNTINLTFDQNAPSVIPVTTALATGSYRPADYKAPTVPGYNFFPGPGVPPPNGPYDTDLSKYQYTWPDGVWSLYVVDDTPNDVGSITNGWVLTIVTTPRMITWPGDLTIAESGSVTVPFSIGDDSKNPTGPQFVWSYTPKNTTTNTFNAALFPNATNVTVAEVPDGTHMNYTMTITPAANQYGTNIITLDGTDINNLVAERSLEVSVPHTPQPPVLVLDYGTNNAFSMAAGGATNIPVNYFDPEGQVATLSVTLSSNPDLLPASSFEITPNSVIVRPFAANFGQGVVTLMATTPDNRASAPVSFTINVTPVLDLFGNGTYINILDVSPANPYPSSITVSSVEGKILRTQVTLRNLMHTYPHDITAVLVGPGGQRSS